MKIDSFLICSNQFHFTIRCNSIKVLPYNFISFCLDGREIFQCSSDEYYLDFYKLSDFGIATYILVRRTNEEICKIIDSKSEDFQEAPEEEKELITEDFVNFEKELEKNKFKVIYFKGELKLTEEFMTVKSESIFNEYYIDNFETSFLDFLVYKFFPDSKIRFEEDKKSLRVETRAGTVFVLRPFDWKDRPCEYGAFHKYDISFCIF